MYQTFWFSVSDLNQISGFGRTLAGGSTSSTTLKLGTLKRVKKMDGDDGGVMAQPTFMLHQPSEPKKKIQKRRKQFTYKFILSSFCRIFFPVLI